MSNSFFSSNSEIMDLPGNNYQFLQHHQFSQQPPQAQHNHSQQHSQQPPQQGQPPQQLQGQPPQQMGSHIMLGHEMHGQNQQYMVVMPQSTSADHLLGPFSQMSLDGSGKRIHKGIVKRWNLEKGYGFIQPVQGGDDVFVHHTVIHAQGFRSLLEGSDVEYECMEVAPSRIRATRVTGVNGSYCKGAPRPPNPPVQSMSWNSGGNAPMMFQLIPLPTTGHGSQQAGQGVFLPLDQTSQAAFLVPQSLDKAQTAVSAPGIVNITPTQN